MRDKDKTSWIEQTHHRLLLCSGVEGFLLGSPPEFPHADIAGTKVEIVLFLGLGLPIVATPATGEHCWGTKPETTNTHRAARPGVKYTGRRSGGSGREYEGAPPSNLTPIGPWAWIRVTSVHRQAHLLGSPEFGSGDQKIVYI